MASLTAPPESTLPYPPLYKDAPFVVLSDWSVNNLVYLPPRLQLGPISNVTNLLLAI